jgi:hypothetical protein
MYPKDIIFFKNTNMELTFFLNFPGVCPGEIVK